MPEGSCSPSESRAVVAIEPELVAPQPQLRVRTNAPFLAHLIAMAEQVPQLREKCRASPDDAAAAYTASIERFSTQ